MADRSGDYSGSRWRGRVVNVMDPTKQGRIQVRLFGLHDNETLIPDEDLYWALPRVPINSGASYRGVAAAPVGVIPGSIVDGYFADSERTILIATGTIQAAGQTKRGEIVDGSYALNDAYNDVTNSARGTDLNAALGLRNLPALAQIGTAFPNVSAGVGNLTSRTGNILSILNQVDPTNSSGVMAAGVSGFAASLITSQLSSIIGNSAVMAGLSQLQSLASSQSLSALTTVATSYAGGASGLSNVLAQVQNGSVALSSLPPQVQSLAASLPGGVNQLAAMTASYASLPAQAQSLMSFGNLSSAISMVSSLASNPLSAIQAGVGNIIGRALGVSTGFSIGSVLGVATQFLSAVSKQREYSLTAAEPKPPAQPDIPTSTSSSSADAGSRTNPYANLPSVDLPPVVTSATYLNSLIDKPQENLQVTTGDVLKIAPVIDAPTPVTTEEVLETDAALENQSIFNQIEQQNLESAVAADQEQQQSIQTALQFGIGA